MKSETDDGLSSCSNFPERPLSYELESDKLVLPAIEHLKWKIGEGDFELLRDVLNRNADVFSKHKADIGCCNFFEHEIELEDGAVPHREGARRMTPHKSEAGRAEIEMLLEYSKNPRNDRTLEIAVGLRGGKGEKEKGAAMVLLRLSLFERGDDKRCAPDTANRREPL